MATLPNKPTYSNITENLALISDKIDLLHECSTKDFSRLSISFKSFFKQANELSKSANELIGKIQNEESKETFKHLNDLYKKFFAFQISIDRSLEGYMDYFNQSNLKFNQFYYLLRNFEQNLLSYNLLIKNLKLSSVKKAESNTEQIESDLQAVIKYLVKSMNTLLQNINTLAEEYKSVRKVVESSKSSISDSLNDIINKLYSSIIYYSDKQKEAVETLPVISENTSACSNDLQDVITYLQFHDIIRQKMEHIHEAQMKLLHELGVEENEELSELNADVLTKISNVATLQSVQLLKANKEYQGAISHIISKLQNISETGLNIFNLCKSFAYNSEVDNNSIFDEFGKRLKSVSEEFKRVDKKLVDTLEVVQSVVDKSEVLVDDIELLGKGFLNFGKLVNEEMVFYKNSKESEAIVLKIKELVGTLKNNKSELVSSFESFYFSTQKLTINSYQKEIDSNIDVIHNLSTLIAVFDNEQKTLENLMSDLNELSVQLSGGMGNPVRDVEYYDCFDSMVGQVMELLDSIKFYTKVRVDDERGLEEIKKGYTVKSEHDVHELIVNTELTQEQLEKIVNKESEESDDVEFF